MESVGLLGQGWRRGAVLICTQTSSRPSPSQSAFAGRGAWEGKELVSIAANVAQGTLILRYAFADHVPMGDRKDDGRRSAVSRGAVTTITPLFPEGNHSQIIERLNARV